MGSKINAKIAGSSRGGKGSGSKPSGSTSLGPRKGHASQRGPSSQGKGLKGN